MPLAIATALFANALIYAGFALVNGRLLPPLFAPFYAVSSEVVRLTVMTVVCAVPANWLLARIFRLVPPAEATAVILGALALVMVVNAFFLGSPVTWRGLVAGAVTIAAAAWFGFELAG